MNKEFFSVENWIILLFNCEIIQKKSLLIVFVLAKYLEDECEIFIQKFDEIKSICER